MSNYFSIPFRWVRMSSAGSGENAKTQIGLLEVPEHTYLFPKVKGHGRSVSHGGAPSLGNSALPAPGRHSALRSASKGHQRAFSHGQIGEGPSRPGHSRTGSKTDFILPPGHREPSAAPSGQTARGSARGHSRQASRSESIYTLRRTSGPPVWRRAVGWLLRRPVSTEERRYRTVVPNHVVPEKTPKKDHPNGKRVDNKVRTTKYTFLSFIPKNLLEQFHRVANLYFIFIVLLNWFPAINAFGKEIAMIPVLFVLGVTAVKDLFEDRRRYLSDKRINNSTCRIYKRWVLYFFFNLFDFDLKICIHEFEFVWKKSMQPSSISVVYWNFIILYARYQML